MRHCSKIVPILALFLLVGIASSNGQRLLLSKGAMIAPDSSNFRSFMPGATEADRLRMLLLPPIITKESCEVELLDMNDSLIVMVRRSNANLSVDFWTLSTYLTHLNGKPLWYLSGKHP